MLRATHRLALCLAIISAPLVVLPACGGSSGGGAPPEKAAPAAPPAKPAGSKFAVDYMNPGFPPVQVEVVRAGTGKVAYFGAMVKMHYTANAVGKEAYASSRVSGTPKEMAVGMGSGGIIPGWDAAAMHMREGDVWKITIPPELAYGPNGGPKVPPNSIVEIELEMVEVK